MKSDRWLGFHSAVCPRACSCGGLTSSSDLTGHTLVLVDERLVNVRDDSSSGDGGADQRVQLLISADGQLQVTGGDTLQLQILRGVSYTTGGNRQK